MKGKNSPLKAMVLSFHLTGYQIPKAQNTYQNLCILAIKFDTKVSTSAKSYIVSLLLDHLCSTKDSMSQNLKLPNHLKAQNKAFWVKTTLTHYSY